MRRVIRLSVPSRERPPTGDEDQEKVLHSPKPLEPEQQQFERTSFRIRPPRTHAHPRLCWFEFTLEEEEEEEGAQERASVSPPVRELLHRHEELNTAQQFYESNVLQAVAV